MQQLPPLPLRAGLLEHLRQAQKKINQLPNYYQKVKQAKMLWQTKKKTKAQKSAFSRIEKALQIEGSYCHYCEGNIGSSIEHFYPRGFYPNLTFVWKNFLWSCQACNTQYKGAKFALFAAPNSAQVVPLVKDRSFVPPANRDAVCLHPRVEDALEYWHLDLDTGLFQLQPNLSARAQARARYTLELLQLNKRPKLVQGRQQAVQHYLDWLQSFTHVQQDSTGYYLRQLLPQKPASFYQQPLAQQQTAAHYYLAQQFAQLPYRSVWRSLVQHSHDFPELQMLLPKLPLPLFRR